MLNVFHIHCLLFFDQVERVTGLCVFWGRRFTSGAGTGTKRDTFHVEIISSVSQRVGSDCGGVHVGDAARSAIFLA